MGSLIRYTRPRPIGRRSRRICRMFLRLYSRPMLSIMAHATSKAPAATAASPPLQTALVIVNPHTRMSESVARLYCLSAYASVVVSISICLHVSFSVDLRSSVCSAVGSCC